MKEIVFVGIMIAFAGAILLVIARAVALDMRDSVRARELGHSRLAMDPLQRELQRALVVQISSRRKPSDQDVAATYRRTA
jgi:hypothetical protein